MWATVQGFEEVLTGSGGEICIGLILQLGLLDDRFVW